MQISIVRTLASLALALSNQTATCEQLWMNKGQPESAEEQRVIGLLRSDPAMRTEFLNRVAAPIANKMFECGVIP